MALRPTSGMGRIEFKSGGLLWRMPGRSAGGNPSVLLVCHSESGTATLCGYSEYTSPSTPPKKYRVQSQSGGYIFTYYTDGSCTTPTGPTIQCDWSGSCFYDADTCALTQNGIQNCGSGDVTNCAPNLGGDFTVGGTNGNLTETATTRTASTTGNCFNNGSGWGKYTTATQASTLSAEDTEDDAIARATGTTIGTSCTAKKETRGAGDFSLLFTVVAYDLICSGLAAGKEYQITYTLTTANYGGASPVVTAHTLGFTATGQTHTVSDTLDCQSGKQVTISGARIRKL